MNTLLVVLFFSVRSSCLVIVPLRSRTIGCIIEGEINSNKFDLKVKGFSVSKDVLE